MDLTLLANVLHDYGAASQREWLVTNGIGGYASGSLAGANTRRYHGLLVAALTPPTGRTVLLSKLEETLVVDGERWDLGTNRYPGTVHPDGYRSLRRFRLAPFPECTYVVPGGELVKTVCMVRGEQMTLVRYEFRPEGEGPRAVELELRPLIAFRDYHSLTHENGALNG